MVSLQSKRTVHMNLLFMCVLFALLFMFPNIVSTVVYTKFVNTFKLCLCDGHKHPWLHYSAHLEKVGFLRLVSPNASINCCLGLIYKGGNKATLRYLMSLSPH